MKKIYLFVLLCISSFAFAGSPLLIEDFNYTAGDLLTAHNWVQTLTSTTNPIMVTSPGLTFNGYVGSGIGNAAGVNNTGQDVNKPFIAQTSGSVYASFLVNATATATAGDYFFHFVDATVSSAYRARTFITPGSVTGKMKVGLTSNASTGPVNMATELNFGQTYLFVAKYKIAPGAVLDSVSLYVFAEGDNFTTEPTTASIGPLAGTSTDINPAGVALRQFDAAQRITVDGIRVRAEWNMVNDNNITTEVSPLNEDQSIGFYPNPVTDGVINLSNAGSSMKDVQIFDVVGKRVFNQQTISNRLDVSVLNAGIYVIKVSSDNQTSSSRLVIK